MFNWFNTNPCEKHDWLTLGVFRQCRKCFIVMPVVKTVCPLCDGGGHVYTVKDIMTVSLNPAIWLSSPPKPKTCPTCKGMCFVDVEQD